MGQVHPSEVICLQRRRQLAAVGYEMGYVEGGENGHNHWGFCVPSGDEGSPTGGAGGWLSPLQGGGWVQPYIGAGFPELFLGPYQKCKHKQTLSHGSQAFGAT